MHATARRPGRQLLSPTRGLRRVVPIATSQDLQRLRLQPTLLSPPERVSIATQPRSGRLSSHTCTQVSITRHTPVPA